MLLTMLLFVSMDTVAKYLTQIYPVHQVVWARFAFHMFWCVVLLRQRFAVLAKSANLPLQLARSVLIMSTTLLFFTALRTTSLPTVTTLMFLSPILVTVLAIPLLGERVGMRRWAGVLMGFTGALIVIRPGALEFTAGYWFVVAAALTNALYQIYTRKASQFDSPMTSLIYSAVVGIVLTSGALLFLPWISPDLIGWLLFTLLGLAGCLSHFCLIRAFRAAPASVVTPFSYTSLLWATVLGYVFFGGLPDRWTLIGAFFIISSGVYVFYRENRVGLKKIT